MPEAAVTMPEAMAVLGLAEDQLRFMLGDGTDGPLPEITVRELLVCHVVAELCEALNIQAALAIGLTAAQHAAPEESRLFLAGVVQGELTWTWHAGNAGFSPPSRPFIAIPADLWLADLASRLAAHRAAAKRPH